ncbi:hypothetical protein B0H19DRAFT_1251028 [Mycena capillaripes]|nr:hypothetical protein B0H19DRAFT_1251028 [Mycena capillaripes]
MTVNSRMGRFNTKGVALTFVVSDNDQQVMAMVQSRFAAILPSSSIFSSFPSCPRVFTFALTDLLILTSCYDAEAMQETLGKIMHVFTRGIPPSCIPYRNAKLMCTLQDKFRGSSVGLLICNPAVKFRQDRLKCTSLMTFMVPPPITSPTLSLTT